MLKPCLTSTLIFNDKPDKMTLLIKSSFSAKEKRAIALSAEILAIGVMWQ